MSDTSPPLGYVVAIQSESGRVRLESFPDVHETLGAAEAERLHAENSPYGKRLRGDDEHVVVLALRQVPDPLKDPP